jgi:xanthomonalisin
MRTPPVHARPYAHAIAVAVLLVTAPAVTTSASATALVTTHVPSAVIQKTTSRIGAPDPAEHLQLSIALPMRNTAELDKLLRQLYDPTSPQYRKYLSVAEFTQRFGPTAQDYAKAAAFLQAQGLKVTGRSANHYIIDVDGPVASIEKTFHVTMGLYKRPTEARNFYAPDREPTLDLGVSVLHVSGLDNFELPHPKLVAPDENQTVGNNKARFTGSGPGGMFVGSDMRAAYYGGTTLTGAGQSVGLLELKGYNESDVSLYFSKVKQPLNVPVNGISADGKTNVKCTSCDDSEQVLDIEYAISMAPGLDQVQVYVAANPVSILNRMASDNSSKSLSCSWGWSPNFATEDPIYKEMAAQGQTFLTASGDNSTLKASGPWPEEDANVTSVGGTDLVTNGAGGAYASETGWSGSAGGHSLLKTITTPSWQAPFINSTNGASSKLRNVPDVSANANYNMYICYRNKCSGGWAGTSFSSPMWAGIVALANQEAAQIGNGPAGFIAPTVYALATGSGYASNFHDVTSGTSGPNKSVVGYDLVTGLGSPNGQALVDALAGVK